MLILFQEENSPTESSNTDTVTDIETTEMEEQTKIPTVDCDDESNYKKWRKTPCDVTCGIGKYNLTQEPRNPLCPPKFETRDCELPPCRNKGIFLPLHHHFQLRMNNNNQIINDDVINKILYDEFLDFCAYPPDVDNCDREVSKNYIFYNSSTCTCTVFTTDCVQKGEDNMFLSFEECTTACPREPENCETTIKQYRKQNYG